MILKPTLLALNTYFIGLLTLDIIILLLDPFLNKVLDE